MISEFHRVYFIIIAITAYEQASGQLQNSGRLSLAIPVCCRNFNFLKENVKVEIGLIKKCY